MIGYLNGACQLLRVSDCLAWLDANFDGFPRDFWNVSHFEVYSNVPRSHTKLGYWLECKEMLKWNPVHVYAAMLSDNGNNRFWNYYES